MNSEGGTDAELRQRKREAHAQLKEKPSDEDDKEEQRRGGGEYCCLLLATTLLCLGTGRDAWPEWPRLGGGKAPTGGNKLRVTLHAMVQGRSKTVQFRRLQTLGSVPDGGEGLARRLFTQMTQGREGL